MSSYNLLKVAELDVRRYIDLSCCRDILPKQIELFAHHDVEIDKWGASISVLSIRATVKDENGKR